MKKLIFLPFFILMFLIASIPWALIQPTTFMSKIWTVQLCAAIFASQGLSLIYLIRGFLDKKSKTKKDVGNKN